MKPITELEKQSYTISIHQGKVRAERMPGSSPVAGRVEVLLQEVKDHRQEAISFLMDRWFDAETQAGITVHNTSQESRREALPESLRVFSKALRRVILVPFKITVPAEEIDKDLQRKLRNEFPGILAWAVRGCLDWLEGGLQIHQTISDATREYRDYMDVLKTFIDDRCEVKTGLKGPLGPLYTAFCDWPDEALVDPFGDFSGAGDQPQVARLR